MPQPEQVPEAGRSAPGFGSPDSEALVEGLAVRFRERLRLFAARRLGGVDLAEDVAQETLRRVTDALRAGRVRQSEALPGFVFQTAQHVCQQYHRSEERAERGKLRLAADGADEERPDQLSGLIAEERRHLVHRALGRLRHDDRELLRQVFFSDLDVEAVAAHWDLTPGALRVRKHRALQRLAAIIEELER